MVIRTKNDWDESNIDLDEFLSEPCVIDEELYLYIGECVPPIYLGVNIIQGGDAIFSDEDGISYYMTISNVNNMYFYLGVLPEFKKLQ